MLDKPPVNRRPAILAPAVVTELEAQTRTGNGAGPLPASAVPRVRLPKAVQTLRFLARPLAFFERCRAELGETFHASVYGPGELVFISDPGSLKRLFGADRINTIAPGRNIVLRPLLGPGSLLLQEGEEHLRRRKLMLPPFHGERMRAYEQVIVAATEEAIAGWPGGEPFAIHPSMQAITLEVIVRAVFGVEDAARRAELQRGLVEILSATASPRAVGVVIPGLRRVPPYRRLAALRDRTDAILAAEIAERRADPALESREDILSMLVASRFEDGSAMDDAELRDQLMTLLLAGHETTATGLAWTFDLLLHRPDTMERLRSELEAGEREYLDAVIEEALRLRPVVPFTGRELRADAELAGYALPAGTIVMAAIYLTHTRPDLYPDPYAFQPERFLGDGPETYSWIPFGGGTRRCIGAAFAQFEMRVAIETILRSVELRPASPDPERPVRRNVTLSPANGTRVLATARL
jgi:cytochrome P450